MSAFNDLSEFRPTCPVIFFERADGKVYTIHCQKLAVNIECYVSTAIIKLSGEWVNRTNNTLDCVFALPTPGTVMNIQLQIGADRILTTAIISNDDAQELLAENKKQNKHYSSADKTSLIPEEQNPYEQYVPELFRLPFSNVQAGDVIKLKCEYLELLKYQRKGYIVKIPLYFPPGTIAESLSIAQVVSISCTINALSKGTTVTCASHEISTFKDIASGTIVVKPSTCRPVTSSKLKNLTKYERKHPMYSTADMQDANAFFKTGRDFYLRYSVREEKITAHCIHQRDVEDEDCGTLCLMLTPPTVIKTTFGRAFFFLLDRSGSMVGQPYEEAVRALFCALDKLRPSDIFNCCAFDHRQIYFNSMNDNELLPADAENKALCKQWLQNFSPERGGTVMDEPIELALEVLEKTKLLPFLMLITDGAVSNERDICGHIQDLQKDSLRTRFLTIGIGSFCNWFFLKMMATLGRGFSEVVVYREKIYATIENIMNIANTPLLTDIEIGLRSKEIEIYPFPIPDLFLGNPIVVAAKYRDTNSIPDTVNIRGYDPHGGVHSFQAEVELRDDLPVDKIFIKQQIDLMTADAWLNHSHKLEKEIISISCANNMPSMYTSTVMFETTVSALKHEKLGSFDDVYHKDVDDDDRKDQRRNDGKNKIKREKFLTKMKNNKKTVAAIAIGGTLAIVAVGVMSFGDVGSTMSNIPILGGGGGDILGNIIDGGCCGECGCDCCDCDDCCGDCECDDCDCDCDCDCGDCVIM